MNTEKFTNKAAQYEKGRPGYPEAALAYIKNLGKNASVFADIGAGTGKFTELIAKNRQTVYGVEPNEDMFQKLEQNLAVYPNATAIKAPSEATDLADNSVDIITVAQALHWFDLEKFKAECRRILKPGGWVAVLYNNATAESNAQGTHRLLATERFFDCPRIQHFTYEMVYTKEEWLAYKQSHSHNPLPEEAGYEQHMEEASRYFDENSKDEKLFWEITTTVYAQQLT